MENNIMIIRRGDCPQTIRDILELVCIDPFGTVCGLRILF